MGASTSSVIHPNNIRTVINPGGDMFWDLEDAYFQVPFIDPGSPGTFHSGALWLSGTNDQMELSVSANIYRNNSRFDYIPGPVFQPGEAPDSLTCQLWDKVWTVTRTQILRHIEDASDGTVESPDPAIFSWPGIGNMHFEEYNGFEMPVGRTRFAPFADLNQNTIYEPGLGEYPTIGGEHADIIAEQISWCVFNDLSEPVYRFGKRPLGVEIRLCTYGMYCTDNDLINRTLFMQYEIENRSGVPYEDVKTGLFLDPDLGCYADDYVGSWPAQNAVFAYNADSLDGTDSILCPSFSGLIPTYQAKPPVQSLVILNGSLSAFMTFGSAAETSPPVAAGKYYHYLSGRWRDGTHLSFGEDGYDPNNPDTVFHAFSGNPLEPGSWSMSQKQYPFGDRTMLTAMQIGNLGIDSTFAFEVAFITHYNATNNHLENVGLMYEEVPMVRQWYEEGLGSECLTESLCSVDCIWAGDANQDSIANERDMIEIGRFFNNEGPNRTSPVKWDPYMGMDWLVPGTESQDIKHVDCNGSGVISKGDLNIVRMHFGLTHDGATDSTFFTPGDHFTLNLAPFPGGGDPAFLPSDSRILRIYFDGIEHDSVYGLSFRIEIPSQRLSYFIPTEAGFPFQLGENGFYEYFIHQDNAIFIYSRTDHNNTETRDGVILNLHVRSVDEFSGLTGIDTQAIRISNIYAILNDGTKLNMGSQELKLYFTEEPLATNEFNEGQLRIYPNPNNGSFIIDGFGVGDGSGNDGDFEYVVTGLDGACYAKGITEDRHITIDVPPGMYVLRLNNAQKQLVSKIVVER